ncbi:MAG TPA: alanine racemase [Acidimicrobiales bacterium]|nr:alanine racemase [Acidimicrobiales bacterium]
MRRREGILRRGLRGPVAPAVPVGGDRGTAESEGSGGSARFRRAWAEIDLGAVRHNTALVRGVVAPAALCAVVKADGYGHGAVEVARAALAGGAVGLAVALVEEGITLRRAGLADPVLLLSEPPPDAYDAVVAYGLTATLCTADGVARAAEAARRAGTRLPVHIKVDTGMHRIGADPASVPGLAAAVAADPLLRLEGLWTHLAVADGQADEDREFTRYQLRRFDEVAAALARAGHAPAVRHVANSAGALAWPAARHDLVRVGIALYGELPGPAVAEALAAHGRGSGLRPALSLKAEVTAVRELPAGARPSYGRRRPLPGPSVVATVPLGYADGVPRALFDAGGEVLIGGRRRPLAGVVTMDQIVVDCGPDGVAVGDEVVLLGRQGDEQITAGEWAARLGTISYEILCGIGPRVPRRFSSA